MTDSERLRAMRQLGVIWKPGRLPRYPARMTEQDRRDADRLYDAMSQEFVDRMTDRRRA
jgi:hypothetical protein